MSERFDTAEEAERAREDLEFAIDRFLREHGWRHTSSTPGSLWLWERTLPDGRTVLVSASTALYIHHHLPDQPEAVAVAVPGWIQVAERMPDEGDMVAAYNVIWKLGVQTMSRSRVLWHFLRGGSCEFKDPYAPTHWMPLPEPPRSP